MKAISVNKEQIDMAKKRKLNELERRVGRSEEYWSKSARDQWEEDDIKGILDWDGTEEWIDNHDL